MIPKPLRVIETTTVPLQINPLHTEDPQGALDATPEVHDHWLKPDLDWTLVAATISHKGSESL